MDVVLGEEGSVEWLESLNLIGDWKHGNQFGGSSGSWIADREDLSVYTASPPVPVGLAG